jgi:hypothetical protein
MAKGIECPIYERTNALMSQQLNIRSKNRVPLVLVLLMKQQNAIFLFCIQYY